MSQSKCHVHAKCIPKVESMSLAKWFVQMDLHHSGTERTTVNPHRASSDEHILLHGVDITEACFPLEWHTEWLGTSRVRSRQPHAYGVVSILRSRPMQC